MPNMKKSQAAMEFLMTYGWAILVVMVVIGSLAYFGVLNPSMLLPEKCTLQMGLYCKNHLLHQDNKVFLNLENGMGKGIIIAKINITGEPLECWRDFTIENSTNGVAAIWCNNTLYETYNNKPGFHLMNGYDRLVNLSVSPCRDLVGHSVNFTDCRVNNYIGKTKAAISLDWYYDDSSLDFVHTMDGEILARIERD